MRAAVEDTQPPASALLADAALDDRLRRLARSPRVRLERLGASNEGRPIWSLVIGTPDALDRRPYHEDLNRRMAGPRCHFRALDDVIVEHEDARRLASEGKVCAMLVGASFGFEASHVEALVALAEQLAASTDPRVARVLDRLLVVIVPLMNPDGRAAAIRQWQESPLCAGHQGSGNAYGIPLNRDFFNLSQPETRAVRAAITRYQPVAAYDPHEDMYHLSDTLPQVCWTPPFAKPYHPDLHPRTLEGIASFGGAIASEWGRRGFDFLYHPAGEHEFLTLFRLGGRFHLHLCLQGVTALITESARRPGSQPWQDRVDQKVTAGLAFLDELASHVETYVDARYVVRSDVGGPDAFILPCRRNAPGAIDAVIGPLLQHGVLVFTARTPEPAYVIPTHQPDGRLVRALLAIAPWNHIAFPPLAGAACLRLGALPERDGAAWMHAPLDPVADLPNPAYRRRPAGRRPTAVVLRNDVEGIAAVNRLIDHGVEVLRGPSGAFAVLEGPHAELEALAASASCADTLTSAPEFQRRVRRPRIAVYGGQGVDQRHHVLEGSVRYALDRMGFPYISIAAGDVRDGILNGVQLLIVPGGWAREIVDGWEDPPLPWQPPGPRDGLGPGGVSEIRKFVDGGGRYLGIGSGGGLLASHAYAGLVDADVVDELLGEARTMIQTVGSHPLVDGLPPYVDEAGRSVPGWLAVPYFSEVFSAVHGGPIFKAGPAARVLAEYVGVDDPAAVRDPERFEAAAHTPAILYQPVGSGWAAIIAFEPGLRGVWRSTMPLLANAAFHAGESAGS